MLMIMKNLNQNSLIHPLADVQTTQIGEGTRVWQFAVILAGATIGQHCNINCHTFIENDVQIGDSVTVKSGVYLWDGITLEDRVFVGPNVTFTNDRYPRSKAYPEQFDRTIIHEGASIGAGSVCVAPVEIGRWALVAAGSVVTKNVPDFALVGGVPARQLGWVGKNGHKLVEEKGIFKCPSSGDEYVLEGETLREATN
jgi:acetyltransferase-like isoleucine patch superfamily enzyme